MLRAEKEQSGELPIDGGLVCVHGLLWFRGGRAGRLRQRPFNELVL